MVYTLHFFSSKCSLFHNSNVFGSCIIHTLYTESAKIKKNNSGAKSLKFVLQICCSTTVTQLSITVFFSLNTSLKMTATGRNM